MFKPAYGVGGELDLGISNSSNLLVPDANVYAQVQAVLGEAGTDYTYMFLSDGVNVELIKVTQLNDGYFSIERGQDGTTARAFPLESRIYFEMSAIAVSDMITAALAAASLPAILNFEVNAPNTVEQIGDTVTFNIPKLELTSPTSTIDVTTVGDGYGIDIERGAFGCCPTE